MSEGRTAGIPDGGAQPPIIDTKFNPLGDRSKVETETTEKKEPDSESSNGADANENDENDNSRKSTHTPEQVAQWVKYQEEVKNYMIRYAAYHAGLQAQKNVEEALAMRAAQAAIITAQHMTMDPTPKKKR